MNIISKTICGAAALLMASMFRPATGEVVGVGANGFEVRETVHVAATSDKAYGALLLPARWWSSEHTFSGSAANIQLDAHIGGCWCEKLPGGGAVEHMRVIYLSPGKMVRLRGALGPFQALAVDGVMTLTVKPAADGTDISMTYAVGGYAKDGFEGLSKAADEVLGVQVGRLKSFIER
jgi:hypothetical protein